MTSPSTPQLEITREIRFAVVMYGGVSLAIYINGIAQELLSMVRSTGAARATAGSPTALSGVPIVRDPNDPIKKDPQGDEKLQGTERVYRKLSYLLSNE